MLKKIFTFLFISVITIAGLSTFSPTPKVDAAECVMSLELRHLPNGSGPPTPISSDATVAFKASDTLSLHYETKSCALYQQTRAYKITYSSTYSGEATGTGENKGNLSKDLNGDIVISSPIKSRTDTYEFLLYKSNGEYFPSKKFTVKYEVKGSTDTNSGSNYKPTNVAICKLADDTSRINWLTKDATNSALEYSVQGSAPTASQKIVKSTSLTNHYLTLTGLTKGKTYGFVIYIPKAGEKIASVASHDSDTYRTFVAGETNDSSCTKDGTIDPPPNTIEPPNNSTPNDQINTGITADLGDLDQTLGSFFNPLTVKSVPELITAIIRVLFALISIAAVVLIIISGFRMVLASGNEEQLTKAKKAITWAIIGLIVSLLSFSIVSIIQNLISRT